MKLWTIIGSTEFQYMMQVTMFFLIVFYFLPFLPFLPFLSPFPPFLLEAVSSSSPCAAFALFFPRGVFPYHDCKKGKFNRIKFNYYSRTYVASIFPIESCMGSSAKNNISHVCSMFTWFCKYYNTAWESSMNIWWMFAKTVPHVKNVCVWLGRLQTE